MSELLTAGIDLMILGMFTVFVFLSFLVLGTKVMSLSLAAFNKPEVDLNASHAINVNSNDQEIAAIAAAAAAVFKSKNP